MRTIVCLILASFLLAGCVDKPAPATTLQKADASATSSAGPDTCSADPFQPSCPGTTKVSAAAETTHIHLEGQTPLGGCVLSPVVTDCEYPQPGHDAMKELGGHPAALDGTLTWSAPTAGTAQMNVYMVVKGPNGYAFQSGLPVASGPSPLAVHFDLRALAQKSVAVGVSTTSCQCVLPVGVAYNLPQDFTFDAVYVSSS